MDQATSSQAYTFLDLILSRIEEHNIDLQNWEIDHLCYRTSSPENYIETKKKFSLYGDLLIESEVNGRQIATYKLNEPIHYKKWIIDLIEVPAPKINKLTKEGFEHIEVVIDEPFEALIKKYPEINFIRKGMTKELNPEIEIEFNDCAVKFHHKSLEHIINIEKNSLIISFLGKTNLIKNLKSFSPCISGTLPLGIEHSNSDLDILFSSNDLELFVKKVKECIENFDIKHIEHQGLESVIINFTHNDLPIELFCQNKCSYKQQANQHFLAEGRILKILGRKFLDEIKALKTKGHKTEPAFGLLLNLNNPYDELLDINRLSDKEILDRLKT